MDKAVIFIPGIKGTKLMDSNTIDNKILWQDIRFNFEDINRLTMTNPVNNKYYDQFLDTSVSPANIEPIVYNEFWNNLNPSYKWKFIFPYDWRLPNEVNAERLKYFIDFIIEKSKALEKDNVEGVREITHLDFVTHSMGNYPVRYYLQKYGYSKIDKIIFVAPPFKGAPDAITALTVGQGFFFNHEKTRKMARTLPALFELLPRYKNSNIEKDTLTELDIFDKNNWQKNLVEKGDPSTIKFINNLTSVTSRFKDLDTWMDGLSEDEKNKILVLAKTEFDTFTSLLIEKNPEDNQPENYFNLKESLYVNEGDGVVPNSSSCCYYNQLTTFAIYNEIFRDDKSHAFIMTDNRVQRIINQYLSSPEPATKFNPQIIGRSIKKVKGFQTVTTKQPFTYLKITH